MSSIALAFAVLQVVHGWLITQADVVMVLVTSGVVYATCAVATLAVTSAWRMGRTPHTQRVADS